MRQRCVKYLTHESNDGLLDTLNAVAHADSFRTRDFEEFGGGFDSRAAIITLMKWNMLRRLHGGDNNGRVAMEPELISILHELKTGKKEK